MSRINTEARLQEPFQPDDVKWRVQRSGLGGGYPWVVVQPYITGRAIQTRLDEVFGMGGWEVFQHETLAGDGFVCTIKVWSEKHERWISKQDVAQKTDIEALKGGASGALKRAGVLFGIGRYLYRLKPEFAQVARCERKNRKEATNFMRVYVDNKDKKNSDWMDVDWLPPILPDWALPGLDSTLFSDAIKSSTLVMGVQKAFTEATNWAYSFSRKDLVEQFQAERDEAIDKLEGEAKSNVNKRFVELTKWLDNELKNIEDVPDAGTVHKVGEHIRRNLVKKCEGQYFDKDALYSKLKDAILVRVTAINGK